MAGREPSSESWRKMVLRSMKPPLWLSPDAPACDVVISSRSRQALNLSGFPFPQRATARQLDEVLKTVLEANEKHEFGFVPHLRLTHAERDYLLGARLISPDFPHRSPGRAVLLSADRSISIMVNEEDHLRVQALTPGWSAASAQNKVATELESLERAGFPVARHEEWGLLTSSPANAGYGRRRSALFHLIGLAHAKRLNSVLAALQTWQLTARGLYGESSRAVGAFFQISTVRGRMEEYQGACEYLTQAEREARSLVGNAELSSRAKKARDLAISSHEISLSDALRVLAWLRWAATASLPGFPSSARDIDSWVASMEVHGTQSERTAARHRAQFLRARIEGA